LSEGGCPTFFSEVRFPSFFSEGGSGCPKCFSELAVVAPNAAFAGLREARFIVIGTTNVLAFFSLGEFFTFELSFVDPVFTSSAVSSAARSLRTWLLLRTTAGLLANLLVLFRACLLRERDCILEAALDSITEARAVAAPSFFSSFVRVNA